MPDNASNPPAPTGELPTGTLTLLFSDIEGSTSLLTRLGAQYGEVLSAQRRILRTAFNRHGGREMGTEGDSFFVVFRSVTDAITAAYEGQRGLGAHAWPNGCKVCVRMGLHTGDPTRHEDGYIGLDVHRAARVAACAHGGQVLVSESTYRIAAGPSVQFLDLGWHRLKDIPEAEHLFQLAAEGLPLQFPPPKSLGSRARLPVPPTPMVGRDVELAQLKELVEVADVRLVTLSGPGGCGKTRLAIAEQQLSADQQDQSGLRSLSRLAGRPVGDRIAQRWEESSVATRAGRIKRLPAERCGIQPPRGE